MTRGRRKLFLLSSIALISCVGLCSFPHWAFCADDSTVMDAQMQEESKGEYGQDTFSGESEASSGLEEGSKLLAERENDKVSGGSEKSKAVSPDASVTDIPLDGDTNHTSGIEANSVQGSADEVPDSVEDTATKTVPSTTGKPPADSGSVGSGTGTSTEPAHADGWAKSGGATYYYEGGERVTGEKRVGGSWYYFDPARGGAMAADEFVLLADPDVNVGAPVNPGHKWVYYGPDGKMRYGEQNVGGSWYYLAPGSGAVSYGFVLLQDKGVQGGRKWVYYGDVMGDGKMRYGEQLIGRSWYYLAPGSGAVSYGFVLLPGGALDGGRKWVYYGPYMGDGKMRKGEQYIDGGWYYLIPATGEVDYEWSYIPDKGKWVYYGPEMGDGRMRYGWQTIRGIRCHFNVYTGQVDNTGGVSLSSLTSSNLQRMVEVNYGFATNRGTASMSDLWKYIDPTNVKSGSAAYYQFADIRGYTSSSYRGLSAAQINAYIDSSPKGRSGTLHNQGAAIVAAAKRYNLNEVYLVSHMILESAWGTSSLARGDYWEAHTLNGIHYDSGVFYNYIGWGAFDNDPYKSGMNYAQMNGWTSPSAAIWGAAKLLHENYIYRSTYGNQYTLYDMRWNPDYTLAHNVRSPHQYCTSVTWPTSIATLMSNCYKKAGAIPTLSYRVPRY